MSSEPMNFPISCSVTFEGRAYGLCSQKQMNYLIMTAREKILSDAMDEEKTMTEEEMQLKLSEWEKTCGYTTMPKLFARMTPDQREELKARYRFSPVVVGKGSKV
jgi:hypothetical protein